MSNHSYFLNNEIGIRDISETRVNPATEEKLEAVRALLSQVYGAVDDLEIKADTVNLNTDDLETKIQSVKDQLDVLASTRASEVTLTQIRNYIDTIETKIQLLIDKNQTQETGGNLDVIKSNTNKIDVNLSTRATEATLVQVRDYLDTVETNLQSIIDSFDVNLSTRASETTLSSVDTKIGEVQATPTQYTLLGRLKDLWDKLHDLFITGTGKIKVWDGTNQASIDATGRVYVASNVVPPPATTPVVVTEYSSVAATADTFYTIPSGETLHISRMAAGAEYDSVAGSVIELYYAPNGNTTGITIIAAIFCNGLTDHGDLQESYTGDGTKAILLRRRRLGGGSKEIFGKWRGYY